MSATDRWLELMADPTIRLALITGLSAAWGILGWILGQWSFAQRLRTELRPMYSAFVGGVGIPVGFLVSELIPGIDGKETVLAFAGLGTGVPWITHKVFGKKAEESALFRARQPRGEGR